MDFVRNYMVENNLNFKDDNFKLKYLCRICDKVLHKPKSAKCGCCFCSDCLSQYTENKCPSCKSVVNLENEVAYDFQAELKIRQLCITCPNVMCSEKHKINEMELHLRNCTNKGVKCIFRQFGCATFLQSSGMMHHHVTSQLTEHLAMLLSNIEDGTNENNQALERINKNMNEVTVDNVAIKNDINTMNDEMRENYDELNAKMNQSIEKNELDMKILKDEMIKLINEKEKKREDKMKIRIVEVGENYVAAENSCKVTFKEINNIEIDTEYFSEVFSINSYHFKIRMYYYLNGLISFAVYLVEGTKDDKLIWPLNRQMKLELIKPDGTVYVSHKFNYEACRDDWKSDFNNPGNSDNSIAESHVAVFGSRILNNNLVTVVLSMFM